MKDDNLIVLGNNGSMVLDIIVYLAMNGLERCFSRGDMVSYQKP